MEGGSEAMGTSWQGLQTDWSGVREKESLGDSTASRGTQQGRTELQRLEGRGPGLRVCGAGGAVAWQGGWC